MSTKTGGQENLPTGWRWLSGGEARRLGAELELEIPSGHALDGRPTRVIARDEGSDDILVSLLDEEGAVALVHLTYAQHPEKLPYPWCNVFHSLEDCLAAIQEDDRLDDWA